MTMCQLFSSLPPESYAFQTRSVRLGGHATSIRLEAAFWRTLEEISAAQGVSLGRFLTRLHDEVLQFRGEPKNFASLLRCACLKYSDEIRPSSDALVTLLAQGRADFPPGCGAGHSLGVSPERAPQPAHRLVI
jgi:predicted DNA-binding ribbon-helix-helix protein